MAKAELTAGDGAMKRILVEVMSSDAAARRLTKKWRDAEGGATVEPTIGLGSIEELTALLSPKRMELLRYAAQRPGLSVRALAAALKRDYKNVHTDVTDLESQHLLERDEAGAVTAPYDEIVIRASLRKAA
jgi:predicted transcriptional regulator